MSSSSTMSDPLKALPEHRRWQRQAYPVASVVGVVRRIAGATEEYVLIRRKRDGYWALPGGKWDFGKSLAAAVACEVKEETGLEAAFSELRAVIDYHLLPRDEEDQGAHFLLFVCALGAAVGEAREQREGMVSWFSARKIDELTKRRLFLPTDHLILEKYREPDRGIAYFGAESIAGGPDGGVDIVRFQQTDGATPDPAP